MAAVEAALPADLAIMTAAVSDWRVAGAADTKIKKQPGEGPPALSLVEAPDILRTLATRAERRPALVIGFAAETQSVIDYAKSKLERKSLDMIIANDVSGNDIGFNSDDNAVQVIASNWDKSYPTMSKTQLARELVNDIAKAIKD